MQLLLAVFMHETKVKQKYSPDTVEVSRFAVVHLETNWLVSCSADE